MPESIRILHLSDLHFGFDHGEDSKTDRSLAFKGLFECLKCLESEWRPNRLLITGDIGWRGLENDYIKAAEWLKEIIELCNFEIDNIFLCPGNHDSFRDVAAGIKRPRNADEADLVLHGKVIPDHLEEPFQNYIKFCKSLGLPPYRLAGQDSYLFGYRENQGLRVVSINSAWFAKNNEDKGKLWIGLPLVEQLERDGILTNPSESSGQNVTIALMHHPKEWFHPQEYNAQTTRRNTWDIIGRRCNFLFTGHTHGECRRADQIAEGAYHLTGGSAFAGASHFNNFRIIRLDGDFFQYRSYEFAPADADLTWILKLPSNRLTYRSDSDPKDGSSVFIAYSSKDNKWYEKLRTHLPYRSFSVDEWDDRRLEACNDWHEEIKSSLSKVNVAICLLSSNYLGSKFCTEQEIPVLLDEYSKNGLLLIFVLVEPCSWEPVPWLDRRNIFPQNKIPINDLDKLIQDNEFEQVAGYVSQKASNNNFSLPESKEDFHKIKEMIVGLTKNGTFLYGRQKQLDLLENAWLSQNTNMVSLVAWGGVGKTTLVVKWWARLKENGYHGIARRVFGWSFYSQGQGQRVTSADQFIHSALEWFGDPDPTIGSAWAKAERLSELIRKENTLLILDGIEPLQSTHEFNKGAIQDPALSVLVSELARKNNGLCVITSRIAVPE